MNAPAAVVQAATLDNLPHFLRFIDDVCARVDADNATKYAVRLAVEEVCTNLIVHGYHGRPAGPIKVIAIDGPDRVTLIIHDRSPPFDPKQAPAPDLTSAVEHRKPGGLGWHLVTKMIDEIRYVPDTAEGNVLTMVKYKGSKTES